MTESRVLLQKELDDASKSVENHYEAVIEYTKEGIRSSREFYNKLALMPE